jgi:hypothetical protein
MHAFQYLYHRVDQWVDQMSVTKTAAIGGAGSGTSFVVAQIDPTFFDPTFLSVWFQAAAMGVGLLTGLSSLALVWMKIVQGWREKNGSSGSK